MMKKARWIPPLLAALFLVPCAWAASQVVGVDGTVYSVSVVEIEPGATVLTYSVLYPGGEMETGLVPPTGDVPPDREPSLLLVPGGQGPFMIWTRNDGANDQVAYTRYVEGAWTDAEYLTSGARDHIHPQAAVDSHGAATIVWVEPAGTGTVMIAVIDPMTGDPLSSPRNLLHELIHSASPVWLGPAKIPRPVGGVPTDIDPIYWPEGGNDTPAIPPCSGNNSSCKKDSTEPSGGVIADPYCPLVVAAVVKNGTISIGVLEDGVVLRYYRSPMPTGAPEGYLGMLLDSVLDQECQEY